MFFSFTMYKGLMQATSGMALFKIRVLDKIPSGSAGDWPPMLFKAFRLFKIITKYRITRDK